MASQASSAKPTPAFDLKGRMATLTILRVLDANLDRCLDELERRLAEAPSFFNGMPVVLDLSSVKDKQVDAAWLSEFAHHLWQHNLAPLAVLAGDGRMEDVGRSAGLGVMRPPGGTMGGGDNSRRAEAQEPAKAQEPSKAQEEIPKEEEPAPAVSRVVTQPVRSGQQVYARGGDLIVLSTVSPGAEVLADGNIHIYGGLRGRALAGVQGNTGARIFCQSLNAELIAIAGRYQVSEHIAELDRGRQVQVFLSGDALCIQPLGSNIN